MALVTLPNCVFGSRLTPIPYRSPWCHSDDWERKHFHTPVPRKVASFCRYLEAAGLRHGFLVRYSSKWKKNGITCGACGGCPRHGATSTRKLSLCFVNGNASPSIIFMLLSFSFSCPEVIKALGSCEDISLSNFASAVSVYDISRMASAILPNKLNLMN